MKMKRFAAALLALILCAAFMTACSPKPEQPAATSGNASSGSAAAEPAATAEPTSAPTPVPPETTAMPEKTDTSVTVTPEKNGLYDALCDLFNNYHEGTPPAARSRERASLPRSWTSRSRTAWTPCAAAQPPLISARRRSSAKKLTDKLTAMYETAMGLYGESGKNLSDGGYTPAHYPPALAPRTCARPIPRSSPSAAMKSPPWCASTAATRTPSTSLAFGTALDGTEITAETLNGAMDGLIFENGAAFNTVTADKDGHIRADLNDAFAAQVRSLGTSGEYFLVGGIVNTLLDAFDGTEVMLTVNGAPLESGHNIYDYALTRYEE